MISTTNTYTSLARILSLLSIAVFVLSVLIPASSSQAGSIVYNGTVPGPGGMMGFKDPNTGTVWYGPVTESNGDPNDPAQQLFGPPSSVSGNSIDFNPQGFNAQSSGDDSEITDSQLSFMIVAMAGTTIENLLFTEAGDTTLAALSGSAFTSVTMEMFIDVIEIDGAPAPGGTNIQGSMVFTPSDGDYGVGVGGGFPNDGFPNYATAWNGELFLDIDQELTDQNIDFIFGATKLNVTLDNTLTAASAGGGSAFIAKKDFDGLTVTSNIPEPTTALLLLSGLLAGVATRRRS